MDKKRKLFIFLGIIIFLFILSIGFKYLYAHLRYRKELSNFEASNFKNSTSYITCNLRDKVNPGEKVEYIIYYRNEGLQDIFNFKIKVKISKYFTGSTVNLEGRDDKTQIIQTYADNFFEIFVGYLPVGQGGRLKISGFLESPLNNRTLINSPIVRFYFEKRNEYIHKEGKFSWEMKPLTGLIVESSPNFSESKIELASEKYREVGKNEEISYVIFVKNSGDMNARNLEVIISNLKFLDVKNISSGNKTKFFELKEDTIRLKLDELSVGEEIKFTFCARVSPEVKNNFILEPELSIRWGGSTYKLGSASTLVKLYPSFENSKVELSDLNGSFTVSGDRILVNLFIVNNGDTDANEVTVDLILSENLFVSEGSYKHWQFDRVAKGDEIELTSELKVVEGIYEDTYGSVRFRINCQELKDFISEEKLVFIRGTRSYTYNYIPIIALHGIQPDPVGRYEVSTSNFEYLLSLLKSNGYKTITFTDLLNYLDYGISLPDKAVIITSDDGYQSVYQYAFPLLKKYGYTMTLFLSTGYIGESETDRRKDEFNRKNPTLPTRSMLIWPEVQEMAKYGIEFQSHGVTHTNFLNLDKEDSLNELLVSKSTIESHIHKPVFIIAWPFSGYDKSDLELLNVAGYRGAAIYGGGVEDLRSIDLYRINRVRIESPISRTEYAKLLRIE